MIRGAILGALLMALAAPSGADEARLREGQEAFERGQMREAVRLFEAAVASFQRERGERDAQTLDAMHRLASAYGGTGQQVERLALNERVLALRSEVLGERHPDTLDTMHNAALAQIALGRFAQGTAALEQLAKLQAQVQGEEHRSTLLTMASLAHAYGLMGRLEEARALEEKVLRLRTEHLGERHRDTLVSMGNLALTYGQLGRHGERVALNEKVLRLRTELLGEKHPDTLMARNNLANSYGAVGRLAERLALQEQLLPLQIAVQGEKHIDSIIAMNGLARAYSELRRHDRSLEWYGKAWRLSQETLGERHPYTLIFLGNYARAHTEVGLDAERHRLDETALQLNLAVNGERHPDTLLAMQSLATSLGRLGRHEEALALNQQVLRLRTELLGERHPDTLRTMRRLAQAQGQLGRNAERLVLEERVLDLRRAALGERHPDTLESTADTAESYVAAGRTRDAAALSGPYVTGAEWQRNQPGLSAENRRSLFAGFAAAYRLFSNALASLGEVDQALRLAEMGKARTLLDSMVAQRASRFGAIGAAEQEQLEDVNRRIGALDQRIARTRALEARQELENARNALSREYEDLQTRLRATSPKYARLSDVRVLSVAELPGLLPEGALALNYVVSGDHIGVYTVDAAGSVHHVSLGHVRHLADAVDLWRRVQADERPLAELLAETSERAWRLRDGSYRLLPAGAPAPAEAQPLTDAREVGALLSAVLLRPLQARLEGKSKWIVAPDGPLAQLAFETLSLGEQNRPAALQAEIHYTQSLSVYALSRKLQQDYEGLSGRRSLFAMGNPAYAGAPTTASATADASRPLRMLRGAPTLHAQTMRDLDTWWPPLPGTEAEVRAVAALFPGSARIHLGAEASEQRLQALNARGELKNYRYLLLSAHGYLSPEQPALSSIVLSLIERTPDADGYVTASEWPGYDLRSDLVVLSACNSAVGRVLNGEGVMGLPFAMFVAGNVNTLLTLWPVADNATADFVTALFTKVKAGQSAARALAATKREFMRHPDFSHPRFWAPFILVGAG